MEEKPGPGDPPQLPSSSHSTTFAVEENEETVITSMTPHTVCKKKHLMIMQISERQMSLLAFGGSLQAFTRWCITVALNGELRVDPRR